LSLTPTIAFLLQSKLQTWALPKMTEISLTLAYSFPTLVYRVTRS
jgi:hypothetical protein